MNERIIVEPGEILDYKGLTDEYFYNMHVENTLDEPLQFEHGFIHLLAKQAWEDGENGYDFEVPVFFTFTHRINPGE